MWVGADSSGREDVPREGGSGQRAWSQVISVSFEEGPCGLPTCFSAVGLTQNIVGTGFSPEGGL